MPIPYPTVRSDTPPREELLTIPLQTWMSLQTTLRCPDVDSGMCQLDFLKIKALYTAALLARNEGERDIWESDGGVYIKTRNKDGDEVITEIRFQRRKTLMVLIQLLKKGSASLFELSRFFDGNRSPENGVWHAIHEINSELNQYGYFVEISKKGVYTIVKN